MNAVEFLGYFVPISHLHTGFFPAEIHDRVSIVESVTGRRKLDGRKPGTQ